MISRYGLLVWFIVTLFVIYAFCLNTAAAVFHEAIQTSLHTSNLGVSIAMGAFIVGFAGMQIPAGYLLDRYNARSIVAAGVLILAVGNVLSAFSHNIILFSLSNLIQGMGGSFAFIAAAVLISQWFSVKQFPILFGLTQTLSCIISGILHSVMANQLLRHSWNTLYLFLAACGAVIFVLTICFVKSPPNRQTIENLPLKTVLTGLSRNNQLILCVLAAAMSFGALLAYASFWYMTVQKYYAVSPAQTYTIGALIFAGIGIGTPIFGAISNYFQSRTMVIHVSLTLGTMMLLAGMYLPHFDTHSLIIIKITSFLIGFLLSGSMLFYTIVSEIAEDSVRGVALSVTNTGVFLFNAAMLFIPTFLITKLSTEFFTTLWIIPCCLLVSILVLYFIKDSYRVSS